MAYLGGTADRDNLDISIESIATKLQIKDSKATGVFYIKNGLKYLVRARKEVIVSAGAINSPQLLMLSGIGPKTHLEDLGIPVPVVADHPVGQNLHDHQLLVLPSKINQTLGLTAKWLTSVWSNIQYTLFGKGPLGVTGSEVNAFFPVSKEHEDKAYIDIQMVFASFFPFALVSPFNFEEHVAKDFLPYGMSDDGFFSGIALSHPKSKGTVSLASNDPFDLPIIEPQYFTNKDDIDVMIKGIRVWEKLMETTAMKQIGVDVNEKRMTICSKYTFRSDRFWECVIRHVASTMWHHSGTCRMGPDGDPTAVVDPQLKVRGVRGLMVVDTSVFPEVPTGNTNAPAIMAAEKASDMIRQIDSVKHLRNKL